MFRSCRWRYTRKRRQKPGIASTRCNDKIYREDVLAHAYAQCRSNRGAPGVDRQDFAEVEAYGVQKWLGELALALRRENYRPGRNAQQAVIEVEERLHRGQTDVVDADLANYWKHSPRRIDVVACAAHR